MKRRADADSGLTRYTADPHEIWDRVELRHREIGNQIMKRFFTYFATFSLVASIGCRLAIAGVLSLLGVGGPGGSHVVGSCSQSQAFFSRAAANIAAAPTTFTPSIATWETAVDTMICGQVTAGTWANKDIEYFFPAPSQALAMMNLVSSSFTGTPHGNLTFDPNVGITGDGFSSRTAYVDTGYAPPSGQMSTSSAYISACVLNSRTTAGGVVAYSSEIGSQSSGSFMAIQPVDAGGTTFSNFALLGTAGVSYALQTNGTQGGWALTRTAADTAHWFAYLNGTLIETVSSTGTIASNPNFYILANDVVGTGATTFVPDTVGIVAAGSGLTGTQIGSDHTLFSAALAAMGINSGC